MPSANGHAPELLDDRIMASFSSYHYTKYHSKLGTNTYPNRPQIQPFRAPKSMNLAPKIGLGRALRGVLEGLGGVLGPSWAQDGPKNLQCSNL